MPALIVFDFDGTLASNHHRVPYLHHTAPGHEEWVRQVKQDQPNNELCTLARSMIAKGLDVQVWTARPEYHRQTTLGWLYNHNICPTAMLMAPDDWRGTDTDLKRGWAQQRVPALVWDDSADICEMYESMGAIVHWVRPWWK